MGSEIDSTYFRHDDWPRFARRLRDETAALEARVAAGEHSSRGSVGGFEIEAWLCDARMRPVPRNYTFLQRFGSRLATMELAQFNFELNNTPRQLQGNAFGAFTDEMHRSCRKANRVAESMGIRTLSIGILPTARPGDFGLEHMSQMKRYKALNDQVIKERLGRPIELDITGAKEHLHLRDDSVMFESAATSFQIHTQVPLAWAHHYYNASILLSAPMVAVSANAPFLFGKALWQETRIPLFEQAVDTGQARVSFGSGFARECLMECFAENLDAYDVLLPILFDDDGTYPHLRLHNGTIWRWNRPLIGFDDDGTPHFRIEHRVMAAGPTLTDMLANAAFYYGAAHRLCRDLPGDDFATARHNFYTAARQGLEALVIWEGESVPVSTLILETLLPLAESGLHDLGIDAADIRRYLGIIEARTRCGRNGAQWQCAYTEKYGRDFERMMLAYHRHQQAGEPVHTWEVA